MIINALVTVFLAVITALVSLLPAGSPWTPDTSAVSTALGSLYAVDAYLPITEIFACMGIALIIMQARFAFTIALFVYNKIRG